MAKVVFDIDNTLAEIIHQGDDVVQAPDYDLIQVLRWFAKNGDEVYAWSAGGTDYTKSWLLKLGLADIVKVIPKVDFGKKHPNMDIAFDDCEVGLAKVNVLVNRKLGGPKRSL